MSKTIILSLVLLCLSACNGGGDAAQYSLSNLDASAICQASLNSNCSSSSRAWNGQSVLIALAGSSCTSLTENTSMAAATVVTATCGADSCEATGANWVNSNLQTTTSVNEGNYCAVYVFDLNNNEELDLGEVLCYSSATLSANTPTAPVANCALYSSTNKIQKSLSNLIRNSSY